MNGIGSHYSVLKSKLVIGIFALLSFLLIGPRFVDIPGVVTLVAMPVSLVHSITVGRAIAMVPISIPYLNTLGLLVTAYLFSVILGYIIHSVSGGSNTI